MKRGKAKAIALTLMLVIMIALIAACGNYDVVDTPANGDAATATPAAPSGDADGDADAGGDVDISIMWWGADARHEATLNVLQLYSELNPHITFTPQYTSWDAFWAQMVVLAATNTMPDFLQMDSAFINVYVEIFHEQTRN